MAPWFERDTRTPFDTVQIEGRGTLDGDQLASKYRQDWVAGKKYPIIRFPSDVERELTTGREEQGEPHVHLFGNLELPYQCTCDEAYDAVVALAQKQGYILSKEHQRHLRIANPQTGRSYAVTFDNDGRRIRNVELFPQYAMDLMPGEVRAILPPLYSQEKKEYEAIVPVKYFTPDANWTWYPTEFDGEDIFFGLVSGYEVELGYFALSELEGVRGGLSLPIERDLYYQPKSLKELMDLHKRGSTG